MHIKLNEHQQNVSQASCSLQQVAFESSMMEYAASIYIYIHCTIYNVYIHLQKLEV